jgi:hypothetical protein
MRVAWLRKFGAPPVRAAFCVLDAEALLDSHWSLIKDEIETSIVQYSEKIKEEHRDRFDFNPRVVVYSLGETACYSCLGIGHYHFYRGALTHEGMVIESLSRRILQALYELHVYTRNEYEKSLEGMSELIAGSG